MQCSKHPFDRASDVCSHCGQVFCRACLVYPRGERRLGLCVQCTIARSGIRTRGSQAKPLKPRIVKNRRKELREALRNAPNTKISFIELSEIPFVPEEEILQGGKGRAEQKIDWCA